MDHIKGVFFDLHGTLLISDDIDAAWDNWARAFHSSMTQKGADITLESFKHQVHDMFSTPIPVPEPGYTQFMQRVKNLAQGYGIAMPRGDILSIVDRIIGVWHRDMYVDPDTYSVLGRLREEYTVGLITNWEHAPRIHSLLKEIHLDQSFDHVLVSDEAGVAKPDPRIFHIALRKAGLTPRETVYVGDMDVDVEGSLAAGIHPVIIQRGSGEGEWDPFKTQQHGWSTDTVKQIVKLPELLQFLGVD